ncbi:MAG: hypothetical protein HY749_03050 [Gammaproteobacteria bacterium]|nr:hypothetical protein [Gammaproteobacteria bacterium]
MTGAAPDGTASAREQAAAWGRAGEWGAALACASRALTAAPEDAELHHELATYSARLGLTDEAIRHFRLAALGSSALGSLLSLATYLPGAPGADLAAILAARRRVGAALAARWPELAGLAPPRRRRAGGRLRLGYLSAHFSWAPYMRPVWGVINQHDRAAVDVHLFADGGAPPFEGYRPHARDRITLTSDLDVPTLHETLRSADLDVVIDLSGYGAPARAGVFVSAPAPLGVSWFNAFGTNGLPGLQVQMGDAIVCPAADEAYYVERIVRLPRSHLAFAPTTPTPEVGVPAAGTFTLGCLAPLYKLTGATLDDWCALLAALPESRLALGHADAAQGSNREHLLRRFERRGIARERIRLSGPAANYEFMANYAGIDLALDTRPYSGGTTAAEALWQGVPVLTWRGDRWAARLAASQLHSAGLADFIAADGADFVRRGQALATPQGRARLAALRHTLRARLLASPACAVARQARDFERVFHRLAHRTWRE